MARKLVRSLWVHSRWLICLLSHAVPHREPYLRLEASICAQRFSTHCPFSEVVVTVDRTVLCPECLDWLINEAKLVDPPIQAEST